MRNNNKINNKLNNKILIIMIIIISILGITCSVYSAVSISLGDRFYSIIREYLHGENPPWYGKGIDVGIVHCEGGNNRSAVNISDTGQIAVGVSGTSGGFNVGRGGIWTGSATFPQNEVIISTPSAFATEKNQDGVDVIWLDDLCNELKLLCSGHGKPLTGKNKYVSDTVAEGYWAHAVEFTPSMTSEHMYHIDGPQAGYPELESTGLSVNPNGYYVYNTYSLSDAENIIEQIGNGDFADPGYKQYFRTACRYKHKSTIECANDSLNGPAKAFVLSEFDNMAGFAQNEQTPFQIAWWNLMGQSSESNELVETARDFQNYINSDKLKGGTSKNKKIEKRDSNGRVIQSATYKSFPLKYDPKFTDTDYTIEFDANEQKWIIGPLKIDYLEYENYAYIYNLDLYADYNDEEGTKLVDKNKYQLARLKSGETDDGTLEVLPNGKYPSDSEEFYILLDYDENLEAIIDIHVQFQYMNAGARYTKFTGEYDKVCVQGHIYGEFVVEKYEEMSDGVEWIKRQLRNGLAFTYPSLEGSRVAFGSGTDGVANYVLKKFMEYSRDKYSIGAGYSPGREIMMSYHYLTNTEYSGVWYLRDKWYVYNTSEAMGGYNEEHYYLIWKGGVGHDLETIVSNFEYDYEDDDPYTESYEELRYKAAKYILGHFAGYDDSAVSQHLVPYPVSFDIWKDLEFYKEGTYEAQAQVLSGGGARWWEFEEIHWEDNIEVGHESGNVKITKEIEGNPKDGDTFTFDVIVKDENGNEVDRDSNLVITYKNGILNTVESKVFMWEKGEKRTFEVKETSMPEGYTLVSIEPENVDLKDDETISVNVTNKTGGDRNGTLKIIKEIEDTKLDTNQYTLVGQQFYFDITISGVCNVTYNGTSYNATEEKAVVLERVPVEAVLSSDSSKDNKAVNINIHWDMTQNNPSYTVKESSNGSEGSQPAGSEQVSVTPSSGVIENQVTTTVTATNKYIKEESAIKIIKTINNPELYSEEDLKRLKFKFKVNVYSDSGYSTVLKNEAGENCQEKILYAESTLSDSGEYIWSAQTDTYTWAYGNKPYYVIEEDKTYCPWHHENCPNVSSCEYASATTFNVTETQNKNSEISTITVETNKIKGQFVTEKIAEGVFENNIVNNINVNSKTGQLEINKKIEATDANELQLLRNIPYEFIAIVSGTFGYDTNGDGTIGTDEQFKDQTIQLISTESGTNGIEQITTIQNIENIKSIDDIENVHKDKPISIKVTDIQNKWTSNKFEWYGEAPYYYVTEITTTNTVTDVNGKVRQIYLSGLEQKGYLDEYTNETEKKIILNAVNRIDEEQNSGRVEIIKKLTNSENCTIEYIKSLRFHFDLTIKKSDVEVIDEQRIVLGTDAYPAEYNEATKTWEWRYDDCPRYSWVGDTPLTYEVQEIEAELPNGIVFEEATGENGNTSNNIDTVITGKLSDSGEAEDITTKVNVTNKINSDGNPHKGKLTIEKLFTQNVDNLSEEDKITFHVKLTGNFNYEGTKNGEYEFDVTIGKNDGWKWTSEDITWYGQAPEYVVTELPNEFSTLVSSQNISGTLENTKEKVATFINQPNELKGKLQVIKLIEGEGIIEKNDVFLFEVKITKHDKDNNEIEETRIVEIKAGEAWESEDIIWYEGQNVPKYIVTELDDMPLGYTKGSIDKPEGEITEDTTIRVNATNKREEQKGKFEITKEIIYNKLVENMIDEEFTIEIDITGTFKGNFDGNDITSNGETHTITTTLKKDETYTSPEITWYGNNAPIILVREVVPELWDTPIYSNNIDKGVELQPEKTISGTITNQIKVLIDLTMDLGGIVWEDEIQSTGKNVKDSDYNGIKDESEKGLDGVEVYVYRVVNLNGVEQKRELAQATGDGYGTGMNNPMLTSGGGKWQLKGLRVTGFTEEEKNQGYTADAGYQIRYDVEFVYDGQTYEPTIPLSYDAAADAYKSATAEDYVNPENITSTTLELPKEIANKRLVLFGNSSLAIDYNREEVNNRIQQAYGRTEINGIGETIGTAKGIDAEGAELYSDIKYKAVVPAAENTRIVSKVETTYESGVAYDLYKTKARTSTNGLEFPVDQCYTLSYKTTEYKIIGLNDRAMTQVYNAIYDHCLHINLGLKRRPEADLEVKKDLYSAKVVVDGKELDYKFNKLSDLISANTTNVINRIDSIDDNPIEYQLGLYSTDYYYRAELYKSNKEVYDSISTYYKDIAGLQSIKDSELEVYLTYKIQLFNASSDYVVQINSINDYVEYSLGAPLAEPVKKHIGETTKTVGYPSNMSDNSTFPMSETNEVDWVLEESKIKGSDGAYYNEYKAELGEGIKLESGQSKYIFSTYVVKKTTVEGVNEAIALGTKSNIIEIDNYTTYDKEGKLAGKLDGDSAPDNLNIRNYNDEKHWYEDDTDEAPILKITLLEDTRDVSGTVWEDKPDAETALGDGKYQAGNEALIGGLTTQLVEKIKIQDKEYDFVWPTDEKLDCFGGKTLEDLTGFDSTIETLKQKETSTNEAGETVEYGVGTYVFKGVPTGTYIVRFLYGNDKTEIADADTNISSPVALKEDGTTWAEGVDIADAKIFTSNYDGDYVAPKNDEGYSKTAVVYNGQDYKSTIYQAGSTGVLTNDYHDLNGATDDSDARDSEYRRLELIAESEMITQDNSEIMATANKLNTGHVDLYKQYNMFADTAKIDLSIENLDKTEENVEVTEREGAVINTGSTEVSVETKEYQIPNINFGVVERPETVLVLDKEIKGIKLTTNDKEVIFDAIYKIEYTSKDSIDSNNIVVGKLPNGKYLIAEVSVDTDNSKGIDQLQAINKTEIKLANAKLNDSNHTGTQNFRFINVDSEILQGTTIELTYEISALNIGDVDYTSDKIHEVTESLDNKEIRNKLYEYVKEIKEKNMKHGEVAVGEYLGTYYYTGEETGQIVKTKVRQLIDYIDNDGTFTQEYNTEPNHYWKNTSINELQGNGFEDERLLSPNVIKEYEILDSKGRQYITNQRNNLVLSVDDQDINKDFERKLTPYSKDVNDYKSSIVLTVTKTVSAQDDSNDLAYDNLAEIVKMENMVGRRDMVSIVGNADPNNEDGVFTEALKERDASATELITFTPPTGIEVEEEMATQILIMIIAAITIVVGGIVIIKKKVLK